MNKNRIVATAALLIAALGVGTGAAHAAPTQTKVKPVHYEIKRTGGYVAIKIADGSFTKDGHQLNIRALNGQSVGQLPLTYQLDNVERPILATIAGDTATLTPVRTGPGRHVVQLTRKVTLDQAKHAVAESFSPRDQQALGAFSNRSTIGAFMSAAIGAAVGVVSGCVIGAAIATIATAPILAIFGAGPVAGCIAGALLFAPLFGAAGLLTIGVPLIIFAAYQYFSTITSPCTTKGAYCQDPARPKPEKKGSAKKAA